MADAPPFSDLIAKAASEHGVPERLLTWLLRQESDFNPKALGIETHAGRAEGIAQFMPGTAKELGVDPFKPESAIPGAARYLKQLYDKTGNWENAVASYGTFATGRGPEADASVREKFRQEVTLGGGDRMPRFSGPRFRVSDYALNEHDGRRNTSVVGMDPAEYLALSPELEEEPFSSRKGKSLLRSVERGDEIDAIPTLDVDRTGKVTDQDGRHRALLAQQENVDVLPVAIRYPRAAEKPAKIQGMRGEAVPNVFKPWQALRSAVVPRAEAAEPVDDWRTIPDQEGKPEVDDWRAIPDAPVQTQARTTPVTPAAPPDMPASAAAPFPSTPPTGPAVPVTPNSPTNALRSLGAGAGAGFGRTVLGAEQLAGRGLQAAGASSLGTALTGDAATGLAKIRQDEAPFAQAHPVLTGIGEFAGEIAPGAGITKLASGLVPMSSLALGATSGALGSVLQPEAADLSGADYWKRKAEEAAIGGTVGAGTNYLANRLLMPEASRKLGGRTAANPVSKLSGEGVQLTPGQVAGGEMKWAENALSSLPLVGAELRNAQRSSIVSFNRAAINRSLDDLGMELPKGLQSGRSALQWAKSEFNNAYDRVLPFMRARMDPQLDSELNNIVTKAQRELARDPNLLAQVDHFVNDRIRPELAAGINGREYKSRIEEELDTLIRRYYPQGGMERTTANIFKDVDRSMEAALERANPGFGEQKKIIDRGYNKFKIVEEAAAGAIHPGHEPGTFTPAQLSNAVRGRGTGGRPAFARGERVLQDLSDAASEVLPSEVPRSGTPERLFWPYLLSKGWEYSPEATMAGIGLAATYSPAGMASYNWILRRLAEQPTGSSNALRAMLQVAAPAAAGRVASGLAQ